MQQKAQRARLFGIAHRLFHLPQYLRLAQHHRIQPAGHAEGMLDRLLLRQGVDVGFDVVAGRACGMPPAS